MSFYEIAYEKIHIKKPKLKNESIKSYLRSIKKISLDLFNSNEPSISYFNCNFEKIKEYILSLPSIASQKNVTTALLVLIKSYDIETKYIELYAELHKELSKIQEEKYLDNTKSKKEEKNWVSGEEIKHLIENLKNNIENNKQKNRKFIDKYQQYLVLNLYTLLPPLRNDYVLVRVIDIKNEELDDNFNYISLKDKELLLYKYKTDKQYGLKTIPIPEQLYEIIIIWEKIKKEYFKNKLEHNFLLLNTTNLKSMKHNTLTKYINKIFYPKKVSSTILRKVYLSEKYPVINTYRDQAYDAMVMGHSINTQKMIYSKKL